MSTSHHDHSLRRGEHVIPADGTIALSGPFDTPMGVFNRYRQAYAACLVFVQYSSDAMHSGDAVPAYLAMEKVLAQSLAYTTNATIRAMVYTLLAVVIPQLANLAKILCSLLAAFFTNMGGRLSIPTDHA